MTVFIFYEPVDKALCSNGYAYDYADFAIPDTLFSGATRMEGESLLEEIGINKYAWLEDVKVTSDVSFPPLRNWWQRLPMIPL